MVAAEWSLDGGAGGVVEGDGVAEAGGGADRGCEGAGEAEYKL